MKRISLVSIIFALICPFFLFSCKNDEGQVNEYKMDLFYDDESQVLSGSEEVLCINETGVSLDNICFHLYPNAFRQGSKAKVVSTDSYSDVYYNGESFGRIEILSVFGVDEKLNFNITGEDENILQVLLSKSLNPNESVMLKIVFASYLPNINHRFGYGESTINFGNFYPILCVYEDGFCEDLYHFNGDPFYSEIANYDVILKFPSEYKMASSGEVVLSENYDNLTKNCIKCEKIRDFSFILCKKFKKASKNIDNIIVNYYGYDEDENLDKCLQTCVEGLETFNKLFGNYPYNEIDIAKSNFAYGGMEYSGFVIISDNILMQEDIDYVIVHEIGHQWWYGVVGNDEYNHAWMDEGLTEFSAFLFFKENESYGKDYDEMISNANKSYKFFEKIYKNVTGSVDGKMDRALHEFNTQPEYVECTYTKGVLMFDSIMQSVGERKFIRALQDYYKKFYFKIAKPQDMIDSFSKSTGRELDGYMKSWINGKIIIQ